MAEAVVTLGGRFDEKTLLLSEPRVKPFAPNVGVIKPHDEGSITRTQLREPARK